MSPPSAIEDGQPGPVRVALVTGATSGIGAACAAALAAEGFQLLLIGLLPEEGRKLQTELRANGTPAWFLEADLADPQAVEDAVRRGAEHFGRLDVVVNNAGRLLVGSVAETTVADWDLVMAVNVRAPYLVTKAALPHLRASGGGSVVNIGSVHAIATMERMAAYAASKGALLALTRQMAIDLAADGIRVNVLVVGSVDTAMSRSHRAALGADLVLPQAAFDRRRIGRVAEPAEIAQAVVFLASDRAAFITGAPLIIDGGLLAHL